MKTESLYREKRGRRKNWQGKRRKKDKEDDRKRNEMKQNIKGKRKKMKEQEEQTWWKENEKKERKKENKKYHNNLIQERCVHHLNAHRDAIWSLDVSADDSLGYFPEESVLAVLHVRFHRLQQKLDFLLAEWKLEGGELLHLCFELVLIWTRRELLMIMADIMWCFFPFLYVWCVFDEPLQFCLLKSGM